MASLDPIFGVHADALAVQRQRMEVLAANIANADTPNYRAREVDFAKVLSATQKGNTASGSLRMVGTQGASTASPLHIPINSTPADNSAAGALVYRTQTQPSVDGNTVDEQTEQSAFADAALHYQASLSFASGRIKDLMAALGT